MHRTRVIGVFALLTAVVFAAPAAAQGGGTLRTTRQAVVMENPRGDSLIVGSVEPGTVLEFVERRGPWFLVNRPANAPAERPWERGWIHAPSVDVLSGGAPAVASVAAASRGRMYVRGFGQAGGTLFTARDSFDAILGTPVGFVYGAGGQVGFPNGSFVQVSVARFRKKGSRALVSGNQVFLLDIPHEVTLTPIEVTYGYRETGVRRVYTYVGAGLGWHAFRESSSALQDDVEAGAGHIGYHVLAGADYPLGRWLSLAGEIRWAAVPGLLGDTGVSAAFDEDDLGGTTFTFKIFVGR